MSNEKTIFLASPRGFCAGVRRALETVESLLEKFGTPLYVYHEIVHNDLVVEELRSRGVVFVEELPEVPEGANLVFSAHGVSRRLEKEAATRRLKTFDATCPLVKKLHKQARRYECDGFQVLLIGHPSHPEIIGTLGQLENPAVVIATPQNAREFVKSEDKKLVYLVQTTFNADTADEIINILEAKYPEIVKGGDLCYATRERQDVVRQLAENCRTVLIIGSRNSSNSNRLREIAETAGANAFLINSSAELNNKMLAAGGPIGISAGASAPEFLVENLVKHLKANGFGKIKEFTGI